MLYLLMLPAQTVGDLWPSKSVECDGLATVVAPQE